MSLPRSIVRPHSRVWATSTSTCWSSAAASPASAWPSTRPTRGLAHRARRAQRLRVGHVVEVVEARARRAALPAAEGSRPRLRGARRAAASCARPRPTSCACCRSSSRSSRTTGSSTRRSRALLGVGDVDVRPHRRPAHRQAAQARSARTRRCAHMPTLPADGSPSAYLYYDAQADDARLTLTIARTAAVARRRGRELRHRDALREGRRRQGRRRGRRTPTGARSTCAPSRS